MNENSLPFYLINTFSIDTIDPKSTLFGVVPYTAIAEVQNVFSSGLA